MATVSSLGATFNTTSGTHTVVATPAVGDLIVIIRANTGNTTSTAPTDTASGSYVLAKNALKATSADLMEVWVRTALITSAVSTTFSDAAGSTTGGGLAVFKVTGMSLTGSAAVRQSNASANQAASTTPTVTFSSAALTTNPVIGAVFNATSPATMTPRTGYTEVSDIGYSTPTTGLETMFRSSGETGSSIAWGSTSASAYCAIAVELNSQATPTVALNTQNSANFDTGTPTFNFTGTDAESNDITYELEIDTASTFDSQTGFTYAMLQNLQAKIYTGGSLFQHVEAARVEILINSTTTYYFDAHVAGPTDPNNVWTNDPNAFDGNTATIATLSLGGTANYLLGQGTTAPSSGTAITSVQARIYGIGDVSSQAVKVDILDSNGNVLGTALTAVGTSGYGSYVTLTNPTYPLVDVVSSSASGFADVPTPADTDPFTSGNKVGYTVQSTLSAGKYYWRVRGIDPSGSNTYGAWSSTQNFIVTTDPYIVQMAKYTGTAAQTNMTFTLPNTPTVGNLLIAQILYYTGDDPFITPTGWTLKQNNETGQGGIATIYRTVQAGDTASWNLTVLSVADQNSGFMYEIYGANTTTPFNQYSYNEVGTATTSITSNSITPTVTGCLILSSTVSVASGAADASTITSGWSELMYAQSSFQPAWVFERIAKNTDTTTAISTTTGGLPSAQAATVIMAIAPGSSGSTLTSTQPAIARIANTITKTQPAKARLAQNYTRTQGSISRISNTRSLTQPSIARVANIRTLTQGATARIANTGMAKTQGAIARIATNRALTQTAISRISQTYTKTQGAISRIANTKTLTQPATAHIAPNVTKTQPAIARIANTKTKTQPAVSRISNTRTLTQPSIARVAKNLTKTQTATANIIVNTSVAKTQGAVARIATIRTNTQTATGRIANTLTKTQGAVSRISNSRTLTQPSIARIAKNLTKTQPVVSRVANNRTLTQPSVARIVAGLSKTQPAISRISQTYTKTQPSTARVARTLTKTQPATASITVNGVQSKTQGAIARIASSRQLTQSAVSRIANTGTKTQPAISRIAKNLTKTQPAISRIANTVTKTQPAVSRIATNRQLTQTAKSRISQTFVKTQSSIARTAQNRTLTQSAVAKIITNGTQLTKSQGAVSRIATNRALTQSATGRIAQRISLTQPARSRISQTYTKTQTATSHISNTRTLTQTATASITAIRVRAKVQTATAQIAVKRSLTQTATAHILHYDTTYTPDSPSTAATWTPDTNGTATYTAETPVAGSTWVVDSIGSGTFTSDTASSSSTWTAEG